MADKDALRIELEDALSHGKLPRALAAARALTNIDPNEARWAQKTGEILRRQGKSADAADAFERAARTWAKQGFLARAIAMAKTILTIDPARRSLLEELDPSSARREHRKARPGSSGIHDFGETFAAAAPSLAPHTDARADEVRFEDSPREESIALDLSELELIDEAPEPSIMFFEPTVDRLALMPSFPLFAELPKEALGRLAEGAELVELESGQPIFRRGDPADSLYAIVTGAARVAAPGSPIMREGDVFGEACLTAHARRTADVLAEGALVALRIPKPLLEEIAPKAPALERVLVELLGRRMLGGALATSPIFARLSAQQRREVGRQFELRRAPARVPLLSRGKTSDGLYLVLSDVVELELESGERREVGPGALIGQRSLLTGGPSDVTARAPRGAVVLRLSSARFQPLLASLPGLAAHVSALVLPTDAPGPEQAGLV